jgi:hypothetical protein
LAYMLMGAWETQGQFPQRAGTFALIRLHQHRNVSKPRYQIT